MRGRTARRRLNGALAVTASMALLGCLPAQAAQAYVWPLELSPSITSSFGEYREEHIHAGVDVKTWGQTGYRVYAADNGYVSRIRTSPWGYGAAVYLRLEGGHTAVYAHLSAFAPKIAQVVEQQQEKNTRYSVDIYLEKGQIPIRCAELVGFSGDTGNGPAHLHFELRDPGNRPVNPLAYGFVVSDRVPPTIKFVAVSPAGARSTVNGGHQPAILELRRGQDDGIYSTDKIPHVFGLVRLAACISDRADRAPNQFAPYRVELYVDGAKVFSRQLDGFSYENTHQVDLDRHFPLKVRGQGTFQNLYVAPGNRLPFYGDHKAGDGTLCYLLSSATAGMQLSKGTHEIRVVASDFYGNEAVARFAMLADAAPELLDFRAEALREGSGSVCVLYGSVRDLDDPSLSLQIKRSLDDGATWEEALAHSIGTSEQTFRVALKSAEVPTALYSASLTDPMGVGSCVRTCVVTEAEGDGYGPSFQVEKAVHADFVELQWVASEPLAHPPEVQVRSNGHLSAQCTPQQLDLKRYAACFDFAREGDGIVTVVITGVDGTGDPGRAEILYEQRTISEKQPGQVRSADGNATASFPPGAAYAPLWPTIEPFRPTVSEGLRPVGDGYEFLPATVPFDKPVTISLRYPTSQPAPEKLGIYRLLGDGGWEFIANAVDTRAGVVRAQVRYFSKCALIADELPPVLSLLTPEPEAELAEDRPLITARVRDFESGIRREEDMVIRLDGRQLISVYDPDAHTVSCQVKRALTKGQHTLQIVARDACGNEARIQSTFSIN